jgi:plasmid stability protein
MATLYVRNVPPELYDELKRRADESGRSLNGVVLDLLEREAARRARRSDWFEGLLGLRKEINLSSEAADLAVASIRAHRDAGPSIVVDASIAIRAIVDEHEEALDWFAQIEAGTVALHGRDLQRLYAWDAASRVRHR